MKKLLLLSVLILFSSSWSIAQTEKSSVKPPGGMSEIQAYSIFYENYKNENYKKAINFGRWIWQGMPETIEKYSKFNLKTNLSRLITSYSGVAQQMSDPSVKETYVDSALMIFDKTFKKYSKDQLDYFKWYVKKGRFYESNSSTVKDAEEKAAEAYHKAYEASPEKLAKKGKGYYMQVMLKSMVSADKKDSVLAIIKETEPYAPDDLKSYFNSVRNQLFDSPEERMTFLEGEIKSDPKNEKVLTQLRDLYIQRDMTDKANEISQKLYKIDSNYENTSALAEVAISNANYNKALKYLKEAMNKAKDNEQKSAIALKISDVYLNKEQLSQARQYARKSAQFHKSGKAYIQIADIYARAVNNCTDNRKMDVNDRVVYWLVLDYLDRAKRVDNSVAREVSRKYKSYKPVTPSTEQKFFKDWKKGKKFKIDGSNDKCYSWINETTTVR